MSTHYDLPSTSLTARVGRTLMPRSARFPEVWVGSVGPSITNGLGEAVSLRWFRCYFRVLNRTSPTMVPATNPLIAPSSQPAGPRAA